jgi:RHS repeat-associated protein
VSWLVFDLHGSVAAVCPAGSTSLADAYRYDAWGNQTAKAGSSANPYRYRGLLNLGVDELSGALLAMGAREYSAQLGTFTQQDSVAGSAANPASMNRFLYALANPATLIDPDGHMADSTGGGSTGAGCPTTGCVPISAVIVPHQAVEDECLVSCVSDLQDDGCDACVSTTATWPLPEGWTLSPPVMPTQPVGINWNDFDGYVDPNAQPAEPMAGFGPDWLLAKQKGKNNLRQSGLPTDIGELKDRLRDPNLTPAEKKRIETQLKWLGEKNKQKRAGRGFSVEVHVEAFVPVLTTGGVIYVGYRLLRLLPSLAFPPSLIPNLAIP